MQDNMFSLVESFAASELISWSFVLRSEGLTADESSQFAARLCEEFLLKRCGYLASRAARVLGREHYVAWVHPDGRLAHAVLAVSPQSTSEQLRGDGVDVLGRRSLKSIDLEVRELAPNAFVRIGAIIESDDFDPGEETELEELLSALPWFAKVLRREPTPIRKVIESVVNRQMRLTP